MNFFGYKNPLRLEQPRYTADNRRLSHVITIGLLVRAVVCSSISAVGVMRHEIMRELGAGRFLELAVRSWQPTFSTSDLDTLMDQHDDTSFKMSTGRGI